MCCTSLFSDYCLLILIIYSDKYNDFNVININEAMYYKPHPLSAHHIKFSQIETITIE